MNCFFVHGKEKETAFCVCRLFFLYFYEEKFMTAMSCLINCYLLYFWPKVSAITIASYTICGVTGNGSTSQ